MNNTDMSNTDMNNAQADAEAEYQRLCAEARASGPDCRDDFDPMEAFPVLRAWARARSPHMINTFDEIERGFREIAAMDARHAELHAETLAAGKTPVYAVVRVSDIDGNPVGQELVGVFGTQEEAYLCVAECDCDFGEEEYRVHMEYVSLPPTPAP